MRQSLFRTWVALGIAAAAVLVVAVLAVRDFVGDVYPECPGSLVLAPSPRPGGPSDLERVDATGTQDAPGGLRLRLEFDERNVRKPSAAAIHDVRLVRIQTGADGRECRCGAVPIAWTPSFSQATPSELDVFHDRTAGVFVVKVPPVPRHRQLYDKDGVIATLRATSARDRVFQPQRVFDRRNLSLLVATIALAALGVALGRSRRAIAYAVRMHAWTEARLTSQGRIENESGALLATLDSSLTSTRRAWPIPVGPVLVAPEALSGEGIYRDMPVVPRAKVAEGSHTRWASATMVRLRDARALAVIGTLSAALAYGARFLAG